MEGVARDGGIAARRRAVAAWAEWLALAGVDCCIEERSPNRPVPVRATPTAERPQALGVSPVARTAAEIARSCADLEALRQALEEFEGCALRETATRLCFADGAPDAPLMLIGEAPGAEEDRQGKPFVGPSGRLLDRMLGWIGLDRRHVWITNAIFWRPPGNRTPTATELAICQPFVERQIELLAPRVILFLGGSAARGLLGLREGVSRLRGRQFHYRGAGHAEAIPACVTFHPAYLLRQPAQKRFAWRDFLAVRVLLEERAGDRLPPLSGIREE